MSSHYIPEWKGSIEGYCMNFVHKNLWRLSPTHEHGDAMSEAYLVFIDCAAHYPMLDTPQHFMALFKTCWSNAFNDLSTKATTARKAVPLSQLARVDENGDEIEYRRDSMGATDNDGMLTMLIKQAPEEVLMVLGLFLNAPQELLNLAQDAWKASGKYSADGERWTERMLGMKPGTNPLKKTEEYFTT